MFISDDNTKSLYKSIFSYWTQLNIEWFLNSDIEDYSKPANKSQICDRLTSKW